MTFDTIIFGSENLLDFLIQQLSCYKNLMFFISIPQDIFFHEMIYDVKYLSHDIHAESSLK